MADILCKPVHMNISMNLYRKQKARKVYSFLCPSLCLSYSDNKRRAIASSFARPFPSFKLAYLFMQAFPLRVVTFTNTSPLIVVYYHVVSADWVVRE